jgi:tellurite resistance-related uncharacterized protein
MALFALSPSTSATSRTGRDDTTKLISFLAFLTTSVAIVAVTRRSRSTTTRKMMKELPKDAIQYSQVPKGDKRFTATTIPRGLLKEHNTKAGTWGVIRVFQGQLRYQINQPVRSVHALTPNSPPGIIEPTVKHEVAPLTDDLEFVVEFHRLPNTGPVDEKREGL